MKVLRNARHRAARAAKKLKKGPIFNSLVQFIQVFSQVGLIEKKPLATEPDQKMAENKVTVIHKIGFKVWNLSIFFV